MGGNHDVYQDDEVFSIVFDTSDSTVSSLEQPDDDEWDEETISSSSSLSSEPYTLADVGETGAIQSFENFLDCDSAMENDAAIEATDDDNKKQKKTATAFLSSSFLSSVQRSIGVIPMNRNSRDKQYTLSKRDRVILARFVSQDLCRRSPSSHETKGSPTLMKTPFTICPDSPGALTAVSDSSSNSSAGSNISGNSYRSNNYGPAITTTQDALLTRHALQLLMKSK